MSRNLLQMTGKIFDEFATRVSEEHKEYIVSVNEKPNPPAMLGRME